VSESQPIQAALAAFSVSAAPAPRDLDEAKGNSLPDSRRYGVALDAILDEVLVGHRQLAIVVATVVRQLDLDPGNYPMRRQAELPVGRAL
jgi:hypothetical protein